MKILIIKMSAIGDVIHTLPALNAIRSHFPKAHITWLVEEAAFDIILGHRGLDRVLLSKRKKWVKQLFSLSFFQGAKKIYRFIKELRKTNYDIIIDFQGLFKSAIMLALARGEKKIGFDKGMEHAEYSHIFYNYRIPAVSMEIHALKRGLILLESLGIFCKKIEYNLAIGGKNRINLEKLLKSKGLEQDRMIICINPEATWETKLWSNKKFGELADRLFEKFNANIIYTGSKSDIKSILEIISFMENPCINLAGLTTLKTLAALYEKTDVLITTDTGPMHLGVASATKVLGIFGSTSSLRTGPYGENHKVVKADILCSPCFKKRCHTKECMEMISVDHVMGTVDKLMMG
ncbi:MAG: lipopolysaccharide heptosyltransferase I [Desulfobacteraceae bacterium 4572_130]|nr:MAG: lipopolysaccharide heptosyltransferase I [Desulfobacteraceae bacterium 4572_130]